VLFFGIIIAEVRFQPLEDFTLPALLAFQS
jgi:hypothetical protein